MPVIREWLDRPDGPKCICGAPLPVNEYADDEEVFCDVCGWHCPKSELQ